MSERAGDCVWKWLGNGAGQLEFGRPNLVELAAGTRLEEMRALQRPDMRKELAPGRVSCTIYSQTKSCARQTNRAQAEGFAESRANSCWLHVQSGGKWAKKEEPEPVSRSNWSADLQEASV